MKAQALADHLAENPVDDEYESLNTYFPDEEVNLVEEVVQDDSQIWKLYFDGAVNIKGVGIGTILVSPTGQHYPATARLRFFCTNNTAEYEACIMGLNMAINLNVHELLVMGDSDLLIRQAQGDWETRDIKLIPYRQCVEDLSKRFKSIEFRYIPRFHNELADALATLASMLPYPGNTHIVPLEIQIQYQHGYCNTIEVEPDGEPWYHDIKQFLKAREYPEHANRDQKRTIRRLSNDFFLSGEILYKRTLDLNLLRCIDAKEAEMIMNEVHSGVCGPHMNGYVLAKSSDEGVGATPYLLVYGTEAVIPAEIEIPSLRIIVEAGIEDTEWVKSRLEQLNLIDEKRLAAEEAKGKFAPNWQGPYLVKKVLSKGALHLVDIEGKVFLQSTDWMCKKRLHLLPEKVERLISIPSATSFD
uniref:RNase H type-1 domain-containing protein n=1 Tax=Nicotiana tabacum TaxID=4097 RepID=A0A1S4CE23_TOBAC